MGIHSKYLAFLLALCLVSCYTQVKREENSGSPDRAIQPKDAYVVQVHEFFDINRLPSTGVFYEFTFGSYEQGIDNPSAVLSELHSKGFDIDQAWYRSGGTGCNHPGGVISRIVYNAIFLVHLDKSDYRLERQNFLEKPRPRSIGCTSDVLEFRLGVN